MAENDVRSAGEAILKGGLVDDVVTVRNERDLTNRKDRRSTQADSDDREPRRETRRNSNDDRRPRHQREEQPSNEDRRLSRSESADDEDEFDDEGGSDDHSLHPDDEDDADAPNRDGGDDDGESEDDDVDGDRQRRSREDDLHEVVVSGERSKVTYAELKAGYQRNADYHNKTKAVSTFRRDLETHHRTNAEALSREFERAKGVTTALRQLLAGQLDNEQMRHLRATDPQRWVIAREDYNDKLRVADELLQGLNQHHERQAAELAKQFEGNRRAALAWEADKLREYSNAWFDGENGAEPVRAAVAKYLQKSGFEPVEFQGIADHRMLVIADKARRYDELMERRKQQQAPQKRQKPLPRDTRQSRGSQLRQEPQRVQHAKRNGEFRRAKEQAKQSGGMRDAAKALVHLL